MKLKVKNSLFFLNEHIFLITKYFMDFYGNTQHKLDVFIVI